MRTIATMSDGGAWTRTNTARGRLAGRVGVIAFAVALSLPTAALAAPRAGVLAEELHDGARVTATALTRGLQQALTSLGFVSGGAQTVELFRHGLRVGQLLSATPPAKLSKARDVDLAVAARLTLRRRPSKSGVSFEATLQLRALEVGSRRSVVAFSATTRDTLPTLGAARRRARSSLLQRAWKQLKPTLRQIARGRGEVLLVVDGLPLPPARFAAQLALMKEIGDARLVSAGSKRAMVALRAARGSNAKQLSALLRKRLGLTLDTRRRLAWWGRWGAIPGAPQLRCVAAGLATQSGFSRRVAQLAPGLLCNALAGSLRLRPRPGGKRRLEVQVAQGKLQARLSGMSAVSASVPLRGADGLAAATWQLARALERGVAKLRPALGTLPALDQLRGGVSLRKLDLLGVLAGAMRLAGRAGPARVEFSRSVKARLDVIGFSKVLAAQGKRLTASPALDRAKLAALRAPRVASLRVALRFGAGTSARRDELRLPVPLWSRQVVDREQVTSLGGLVDTSDERVRRRVARALAAARSSSSLLKLERGVWLPLVAYGALFASRPRLLADRPASRLAWRRLPGETLGRGAGTRRDLALAFASLAQAGGARTRLLPSKAGLLVAVDTGWLPSAAGLARAASKRFVALDGTLWLPLWIDGKGNFDRANRAGARRLRKLSRRARAGVEVLAAPQQLPTLAASAASTVIEAGAKVLLDAQRARAKRIVARARLDRGSIKKRLGVAQKLLQIRAVARARQLLEGYLVLHEGDRRAQQLLAVSYAYQGAFELARRHFARARGAQAQLGAGLMSWLLGQRKRARGELARAGGAGRLAQRRLMVRRAGVDPQTKALGMVAGATNLQAREALLGRRAGPDRRVVRWALDLLRY
jgi:hypothetical protein